MTTGLENIYNWIAKDNPVTAKAVVERLFESIEHLATFPQMGHAGRDEARLIIVAVPHGAQEREGRSIS